MSKTSKLLLALLLIVSFVYAKEANEEGELRERLKEVVNELDRAYGENTLEESQILDESNYFNPLENEIENNIYPAILNKLLYIKDDCSTLDNISTIAREFEKDSNTCKQVLSNLKFKNEAIFQKANESCDRIIRTKIIPNAFEQYIQKCDSLKNRERYSNNKFHLIHSISQNYPCKLNFKLINKTNSTLSKNSISARILEEGYWSSNNIGYLVSFEKLAPNESAEGNISLQDTQCKDHNIVDIGFSNIQNAIKDGITSYDIFEVSSKTGRNIIWKFNQYSLTETINLRNPIYRARKEKINSCLDNCQKRMEACVMTYRYSTTVANKICGMPHAGCINGCNSVK